MYRFCGLFRARGRVADRKVRIAVDGAIENALDGAIAMVCCRQCGKLPWAS